MTSLAKLEQTAQKLSDSGKKDKLFKICEKIIAIKEDHPVALDILATRTFSEERYDEAATYLAALSKLHPENSILFLKHGYCHEMLGKIEEALKAYQDCIRHNAENAIAHLYLGYAHILLENEAKAAEIFSLGEDIDGSLLIAHLSPDWGDVLRHRSKIAQQTVHKALTNLHLKTIEDLGCLDDQQRIYDAVWPQVDTRDFEYGTEEQKPHLFYIPDLLSQAYFERSELNWTGKIEAAFDDIKQEIIQNLDIENDGEPYLDADMPLSGENWDRIVGKKNWAAIHLYNQGKANEDIIAKYPKMMKALKHVPLTEINGNPSEVFISVLNPNTCIPPHFGVSNNTLTVHFPIIVPEGCGLRAGQHKLEQKEGQILAFDDSYDHEAWNDSDDMRVVLIFEAWHPDLTDPEKQAISATFEARLKWLENRKIE